MVLTVKFVKSIVPYKVRKYVCKDYCGDKKQVWINFGFWDITDGMKKESFKAFKKNKIRWYHPWYGQEQGYFLFKENK